MEYYVYILTNESKTTIYVGVTNDLERRVYEHKNKLIKGFTSKYKVDKLIYYEQTTDIYAAISREKQIKSWNRERKEKLINNKNPEWKEI